jgi:DNA-binding IclR family transcriptional regulator
MVLEPDPSGSELSTVHSVDRALLIVETLMRDDRARSAREVAAQTGINRTTAHRLINALIHRGWIEKVDDSATYRLSLKFLVLANLAHESRDVLAEMRPTLAELSLISRETVHVGVLDGFALVHVGKVDSPERVGISSKIGTRAVPHVTSLGKALLAASDDETVENYITYASTIDGEFVLVDHDAFRQEIAETRQRGYSRDDEEDAVGVRCIGAAIRAAGGAPLFAVSLTGPAGRFTRSRADACAPALVEAAAALSGRFGWASRGQMPMSG